MQADLNGLGPQQRHPGPWYLAAGSLRPIELWLEDFKQLLDQLAISRGRDYRIHAIAELHQAYAALVVHRQANNAFERSCASIIERDLDTG